MVNQQKKKKKLTRASPKTKVSSEKCISFKLDDELDGDEGDIEFEDDSNKTENDEKIKTGKGKVIFKLDDEDTDEDNEEMKASSGKKKEDRKQLKRKKMKKKAVSPPKKETGVRVKRGKDKEKADEEEDGEEKKTAKKIKPEKTATKLIKKREVVDKNKVLVLAKKNMEIEKALENFKRAYRSLREEVDTLASQRDTKEALINKYQNKLELYVQDFDNFKLRAKKEKKEIEIIGNQRLIKKMLGIYDNLDRAIENTNPEDNAKGLLEGVEMMRKSFLGILAEENIEEIESIGKKFNPRLHEAIAMVENPDYDEDVICREMQRGFKFKDEEVTEEEDEEENKEDEGEDKKEMEKKIKMGELIRPAMVHVSKGGRGKKRKAKVDGKEKDKETDDNDLVIEKKPKESGTRKKTVVTKREEKTGTAGISTKPKKKKKIKRK